MTMLDHARAALERKFYVFPCMPKTKKPAGNVAHHGFKSASNQPHVIEYWWKNANPNFNIGIATEISNICALDFDSFPSLEDAATFIKKNSLPSTYVVRSGKRPAFGLHIYYTGLLDSGFYELDGVTFEAKSIGACITAAGSIHPDSGEPYAVLCDKPVVPLPEIFKTLKRKTLKAQTPAGEKVIEGSRDNWLVSQAGRLINIGLRKSLLVALAELNELQCAPPKTPEDVRRIATSAYKNFQQKNRVKMKEAEHD